VGRRSDRRVLGVTTAILVAAALGFALSARPPVRLPSAVVPGSARAAFEAKCASCHAAADLAQQIRESEDPTETRAHFSRFLQSHGGASLEEGGRILDWIEALADPPA